MNARVTTLAPVPFPVGVLRLVRFDLRRFRWLAALVVALEMARAAFVEWSLHRPPGDRVYIGTLGTEANILFDLVLSVGAAVTTALVVQADLPSDDRAFWRTRPIAPLTLSLGKVTMLALLLVAVPASIDACRLVAYGAPAASIGARSLQLTVLVGAVVVPAWAFALVTRTFARFVVGALGLVVGVSLAVNAAAFWMDAWFPLRGMGSASVGMPIGADWQGLAPHGWWAALATTLAGLAIIAAHYRHRRTGLSALAGAALIATAAKLPAGGAVPPAAPALSGLVTNRLEAVRLLVPPVEEREPLATSTPVSLQLHLTLPPMPLDISTMVVLRAPRLRAGRSVAASDATYCCFNGGVVGAFAPELRHERAVDRQYGGQAEGGLAVAATDLAALRGDAVSIDAAAEVHFVQHRLAGEVPLRPGTALRVGHHVIEILEIRPAWMAVLVRFTTFPTLGDPRDGALTLFVGDHARTRLSRTLSPWDWRSPVQIFFDRRPRTVGSTWVGLYHVHVPDPMVLRPDARLFVMESRPAGALRFPWSAEDVPMAAAAHPSVGR